MNKAKVVIASVLKPVTEPRAFHKIALSLRETSKYQINIIGFCSKKTPHLADIRFTTIFCRHRTHPLRALVPLRLLWEIIRYRPALVIVTTYELLPMVILGKFFLRFRLVYDVQENYHQNILLNQTVPSALKGFLALLVKMIEKTAHPFIDHYIFAEQSYASEFPQITQSTILENKYAGTLYPLAAVPQVKKHTFIISGTITPVYGIENAINWFQVLLKEYPSITLHIIGHVPVADFRSKTERLIAQVPRISSHLSSTPLPHESILTAVQQSEIVLMPYEIPDSIRFKIPSKLYESIALRKAILISKNPLWEKILAAYPAGLAVDFTKTQEATGVYQKLKSLRLYQKPPGKEVTWEGEKAKLGNLITRLLS